MTGTNGFLGAWALKVFLDAGFSVRAILRDEIKATHLKQTFSAYMDKLDFVIVSDFTKVQWFSSITVRLRTHPLHIGRCI